MFQTIRGLVISRRTLSRNLVNNLLVMNGVMSDSLPPPLFDFMVGTVLAQPGAGYFAFRGNALYLAHYIVQNFISWIEGDEGHLAMARATATLPHPCDPALAQEFSQRIAQRERESLQALRMAVVKQQFMARLRN